MITAREDGGRKVLDRLGQEEQDERRPATAATKPAIWVRAPSVVVHRRPRTAGPDRESLGDARLRHWRRRSRTTLATHARARCACRRTHGRSGSRRRTRRGRRREPPARARATSASRGVGIVGRGRPPGTGPTMATPWLAKSRAHDKTIAVDYHDQCRSARAAGCGARRATLSGTTRPTAIVMPLASPSSRTTSQSRSQRPARIDVRLRGASPAGRSRARSRPRGDSRSARAGRNSRQASPDAGTGPAGSRLRRVARALPPARRRASLPATASGRTAAATSGRDRRPPVPRSGDAPTRGARTPPSASKQRVQAVDRREAGQLAVGHRRREGESRDRQSGDDVAARSR